MNLNNNELEKNWRSFFNTFIFYVVAIILYIGSIKLINEYLIEKDPITQGAFFTIVFLIGSIFMAIIGVMLFLRGNRILEKIGFKFRWYHFVIVFVLNILFFLYCFNNIEIPFLINVFGIYPIYFLFIAFKVKVYNKK